MIIPSFYKYYSHFEKSAHLNKSKLLLHLGESATGIVGGFLCSLLHLCFQVCFICHQLGKTRLNGSQRIRGHFTYCQLEITVAEPVKFTLDFAKFLSGKA